MNTIIVPPFTDPEQAINKVQVAEDLWNTRDPDKVAARTPRKSIEPFRDQQDEAWKAIVAKISRLLSPSWDHHLWLLR